LNERSFEELACHKQLPIGSLTIFGAV